MHSFRQLDENESRSHVTGLYHIAKFWLLLSLVGVLVNCLFHGTSQLRRYEEVIRFCGETLHLAERNSVSMCLDEHPENINLDICCSSVKLWRYYLITKSYFFTGKLEEAHQFLKKHDQAALVEYK
jgi:hypothetical protein